MLYQVLSWAVLSSSQEVHSSPGCGLGYPVLERRFSVLWERHFSFFSPVHCQSTHGQLLCLPTVLSGMDTLRGKFTFFIIDLRNTLVWHGHKVTGLVQEIS